jgi:hypothetical protein
MIEHKVKEIVSFIMKNNEKVYYFENDSNRNACKKDGLYLKPKADSTQRNFELISNEEELEFFQGTRKDPSKKNPGRI